MHFYYYLVCYNFMKRMKKFYRILYALSIALLVAGVALENTFGIILVGIGMAAGIVGGIVQRITFA